jgi:hypothetical protein
MREKDKDAKRVASPFKEVTLEGPVRWGRGTLRLWMVLTALCCFLVFGWVYKLAVDGAGGALERATDDCSGQTGESRSRCVAMRSEDYRVSYDATVGGYLGRILSGESLALFLFAMIVPPLLVLGAGAVAGSKLSILFSAIS